MKIALCLFGYPKGSTIYAGGAYLGKFKHLFDKVMVHNPDVFIHSWDVAVEQEMVDLFKPKKHIFEKQRQFKEEIATLDMNRFGGSRGDIFKTLSFFYTRKTSNDLRLQHEEESGTEYDCVLNSRFDVGYHNYGQNKTSYIKFDPTLDMNAIYNAYWDQINAGISDHWFYSSSDNINTVCNIYDHVLDYLGPNSEYMTTMMDGCFDTNQKSEFSNEFLKEEPEKTTNYRKVDEPYTLNNHALYKWHFYKNNLWNREKTVFLNKELWKND